MANIYEIRRYGKAAFLVASAVVVALFIYLSMGLIRDLSMAERERMQIWADATKELATTVLDGDSNTSGDIEFLLSIIQSNTTIPVLLTDSDGNILDYRNFDLPHDDGVPAIGATLSAANKAYLSKKLAELSGSTNKIEIEIAPDIVQYLYYEDSTLLKRMSVFPYIQILVMLVFVVVVYFAVLSTKKAEQNKVWVGLSKETAHQLGTPISSLMAWMELLPDYGVDRETVAEMNKDVNRLSTIASRFSKIGSVPSMERADLNDVIGDAVGYMKTRISPKIALSWRPCEGVAEVRASVPLLEWVVENLIKNAVDATDLATVDGRIDVSSGVVQQTVFVEVADTGKGISRKNFKTVFRPGYSTKKRGWGLGLTLAKRIIEQYHGGKIFVKQSIPGEGSVFRIELPLFSK